MAANREYELKFTFAADEAERLVSHPLIRPALSRRQISRLVSTYFDTPDARLQRHRFGLRVRRSETDIVHTLKQVGGSLIDRGEWERVDTATRPNVVWLRETPLAPLLDEADVADRLGPRFSVDVTRTTMPLRHRRAEIEVALDQGTIVTEGLSLPIDELELEVKKGKPKAALHLARSLVRDLPMTLSLASKSERGYAVNDLTWGQPTETIDPALKKRMTVAEAFEAITQACLHAFLKNIALIGGDADEEAVHKSRIALRHLRAAFQLFKPALRRRCFATLRRDIKWLSDRLGGARDADVFQADFFDPLARGNAMPGAGALASLMSEYRRRAHRRLRKALASARARLLFVEILAFSTTGIRRKVRAKPYRRFVRSQFERRRHALAGRARHITEHGPTEAHDVRKAAKMLRYGLDLLGETSAILRGKKGRLFSANLKTLQKSLGLIQDEEAMRDHLRATVLAPPRRKRASPSEAFRQARFAAAEIAAQPIARDKHLRQAEAAARRL